MEQFGKTCLPDETKYKFKAQYDKVTGAPYVDCCKFFFISKLILSEQVIYSHFKWIQLVLVKETFVNVTKPLPQNYKVLLRTQLTVGLKLIMLTMEDSIQEINVWENSETLLMIRNLFVAVTTLTGKTMTFLKENTNKISSNIKIYVPCQQRRNWTSMLWKEDLWFWYSWMLWW